MTFARFIMLAGLSCAIACGGAAPPPPVAVAPTGSTAPVPTPSVDHQAAQAAFQQGVDALLSDRSNRATLAESFFVQALEHDPNFIDAWWELGWAQQVLGNYDGAVLSWDEVRKLRPDHPELDDHYASLLMRRDQAAILKALPDPGVLPPPEQEPRKGPTLRLRAVGDIQMGRAWPEERAEIPPNDGMELLERVADELRDADLTFGNLETVLADQGESKKCKKRSKVCYAFRAPTRFAKTLKNVGFDLLSIANNHTADFGEEGRAATAAALDAQGLVHSGPIGDIGTINHRGLLIGLVAFGTGEGLYRVQDIETAVKVVAAVDRAHDLVIVSFHGGAEGAKARNVPKKIEKFYGENRGDVHAFAHALVDAGADIVLGHGPHVVRAMEVYRNRLIAYSLGNFSAWYGFNLKGPLGRSLILEAELAANGVLLGAKVLPLVLEAQGIPTPDPESRSIKDIRTLSTQDMGEPLFDKSGRYQRPLRSAS